MESGGAAVKTDSVRCAAESGEVFLELSDFRSEAVGAGVEGFGNHSIDFFAQRTQLGRQVEVMNWCCHLNGIIFTEVNEENKGKTERVAWFAVNALVTQVLGLSCSCLVISKTV